MRRVCTATADRVVKGSVRDAIRVVAEVTAHVVGEEHQVHRGGLRAPPDVDVASRCRRRSLPLRGGASRHVVAVADREDPEIHLSRCGRTHEARPNRVTTSDPLIRAGVPDVPQASTSRSGPTCTPRRSAGTIPRSRANNAFPTPPRLRLAELRDVLRGGGVGAVEPGRDLCREGAFEDAVAPPQRTSIGGGEPVETDILKALVVFE